MDGNTYICDECSKHNNISDRMRYVTHDGNVICGKCYSEKYFTCNDCDGVFDTYEYAIYDNDETVCNDCFRAKRQAKEQKEECDL